MYNKYKEYYSIVLQPLADAQYKFVSIEVGAYGTQSDGGIFSKSTLCQCLRNSTFNMPADTELPQADIKLSFVIIGDEAYPYETFPEKKIGRLETHTFKERFVKS